MRVYGTYKEIIKKHMGELNPNSVSYKIVEEVGSKVGLKEGLNLGKALIENYFLGNLVLNEEICKNSQERIDGVLDLLDKIKDLEEKEKNNWEKKEEVIEIKEGTLLLIKSQRHGQYFAKAKRDFKTDEEWYPVVVAEKRSVSGLANEWVEGEDIPCRKSLCKIEIVKKE